MQVAGIGLASPFGTKKVGYNIYRQDIKGKDYMRENLRRLRQIQKATKSREFEAQKPVKALWHSEKYKDVQSKVKAELDKPPPLPRPESANFLRSHSRSGSPVPHRSRPPSPQRSPTPDRLSVPTASSAKEFQVERNNIDFIKLNSRDVKQSRLIKSPSVSALDDLKYRQEQQMSAYQPGVVPKYLKERQERWKHDEEERIANTPDPAMPEGHRSMGDIERRDTLQLLEASQKQLMRDLQSLPLTTDTLRVRSRKQQLELKLSEVDEAIKIFSRPKVFVKLDS